MPEVRNVESNRQNRIRSWTLLIMDSKTRAREQVQTADKYERHKNKQHEPGGPRIWSFSAYSDIWMTIELFTILRMSPTKILFAGSQEPGTEDTDATSMHCGSALLVNMGVEMTEQMHTLEYG